MILLHITDIVLQYVRLRLRFKILHFTIALSILRTISSPMSSSHCKTSLLTLAPLTLSPSLKTYILQLEDLQGKAGVCCHRKKSARMATRFTAPSFPGMLVWHGKEAGRFQANHKLLPIIWSTGGCDWVGVCGPTGSLSSLEPSGRCFHHRRQLARHQSVPPSSCTPAPPHLLSDTRSRTSTCNAFTCNTSTCTSYTSPVLLSQRQSPACKTSQFTFTSF